MKKTAFLAIAFTVIASSQIALAAPSVLLQTKTVVGFAPPDIRGTYTTQINSDGTIVYTNNKDVSTVVAKLSKQTVKSIKMKIKEFSVGELVGEEGPGCMDAPWTQVTAMKDGKEVVIKSQVACNTKQMYEASELNSAIHAAETFSLLNRTY